MKRKPLHIDWDELETAFENRSEDLVYYLDLVTGQVVLEGEGEDDRVDDDTEMADAIEDDAATRPETTRLYVVSFTDEDELDWMDEFIEGDEELSADLKERLLDIAAQGPPQKFKGALRQHGEVRDRWFRFRSERLHEVMNAWLDAHTVSAAAPPPWK